MNTGFFIFYSDFLCVIHQILFTIYQLIGQVKVLHYYKMLHVAQFCSFPSLRQTVQESNYLTCKSPRPPLFQEGALGFEKQLYTKKETKAY